MARATKLDTQVANRMSEYVCDGFLQMDGGTARALPHIDTYTFIPWDMFSWRWSNWCGGPHLRSLIHPFGFFYSITVSTHAR